MLIVGDSTGNDSTEWVDLFCAWAATNWPKYTVRRYLWDNVGKVYSTPVDFNTGTTSLILSVWNCSVPGSKMSENFGSPFVNAFVGKHPQLIIVNHGYNYQNGVTFYAIFGGLSAGVESLLREYPSADVMLIAQSPALASDLQAINIRAIREYAAIRGFGVADVYGEYVKAGKPADWYNGDGIHPSEMGSRVWFSKIKPFFFSSVSKSHGGSTLDSLAKNLLANGDFSAVTSTLPDSWTLTNATSALETTLYELGPRAIKVTANGATPRLQQDILTTNASVIKQISGGWVTLAVRVYVPAGGATTCGVVALRTDDSEFQCAPVGANGVTAGYHWRVCSAYVRRSPTLLRVYLYADTATGTTQYSIFDRAILVKGLLPIDV